MTMQSAPQAAAEGRRLAVSPMQRAWLRELGLEKVWLAPSPLPDAAATKPEHGATQPNRGLSPIDGVDAQLPEQAARTGTPNPAAPKRDEARPAISRPDRPSMRPSPNTAGTANGGAADVASGALREDQTAAVAHLDMQSLEQRVLGCEACGLCAGRKHAVFGTGAQPASWLIVGEAPGEQEDRQGLPFVGRSGQLLDAMLASVGCSREQNVYITNVIKCRPPGNRNPKPDEIAACRPYLMRQIALLKPERILVVGRFAAQTLLDTDATIGSLRGRQHALKTEEGREIPVVVSYHPAYLLRSPNEKAKAWADLQLATRT